MFAMLFEVIVYFYYWYWCVTKMDSDVRDASACPN